MAPGLAISIVAYVQLLYLAWALLSCSAIHQASIASTSHAQYPSLCLLPRPPVVCYISSHAQYDPDGMSTHVVCLLHDCQLPLLCICCMCMSQTARCRCAALGSQLCCSPPAVCVGLPAPPHSPYFVCRMWCVQAFTLYPCGTDASELS